MSEVTQQNPVAAHIVLDLETLSTKPTAAVIAIGAVAVSATGLIVGEFHIAVDGYNQPGRDIDAATLAWWDEQTPEAKAASLQATDHVSATVAMCKFSAWVLELADPTTVKVWGNGSSFDCTILSSLYAQCHELGYPQPWAWWNDRDMRTLVDAFPTAKQVGDFVGIEHHALHDARHEAKQLAKALPLYSAGIEAELQALRKKVATYEARDALGWLPPSALATIEQALRDYHFALDSRQHGGVAADQALNTIAQTMGMHWKQGEEAARRAATKQGGA